MKITNLIDAKNIIVDSDLGYDPDDLFALCYLHSAGVNIRAITLSSGDPHQIALAQFFCKEVGLNIPIGVAELNRKAIKGHKGKFEGATVKEYVGFHHNLLKAYGYPCEATVDELGCKVIADTYKKYPDCELFIIGAPKNVGRYIRENPEAEINQVTFQGGFIGYQFHSYPCERLDKFVGKATCPSYNPNGAIKDTQTIVGINGIKNIRFVSKNICHTIVYDKAIHDKVCSVPSKNKSDELFIKGMDLYLSKHKEKKFHDPCAAVCMLHPEIGSWVRGMMFYDSGGWGTLPDETSKSVTIADIDRDKFWGHIINRD